MAPRSTVVFHYKPAGGRLSPVASVGLQINSKWTVVETYVDSGAFYTLFNAQLGKNLGLDLYKGRKVLAQVGDGSLIPVFLHRLPMQIGPYQFTATVGFSEKLGVRLNLLGRQDIFDRFRICFDEKRRTLSFQPTVPTV
jgi:hypothetical protein